MPQHNLLPMWLGLYPDCIDGVEMGTIKSTLARQGVNGRGWRLYLDYGDDLFQPLCGQWFDGDLAVENAVAWLRVLQACEMDVLPPVRLVRSLSDWGVPDKRLDLLPPPLLRAAWKACVAAQYKSELLCDFVTEAVVPVARRFFESGANRQPNLNLLKAGWSALQRHYFPPPETPQKARRVSIWKPVVRHVECGVFCFEALDSIKALVTEGRAMHHCIGSYGERLAGGMLIAFSIKDRKSKARIATMTASETRPGCWEIGEIKGPNNEEVPTTVQQAAFVVIRVLEDAYANFDPLRSYVDDQRQLVLSAAKASTEDEDELFF